MAGLTLAIARRRETERRALPPNLPALFAAGVARHRDAPFWRSVDGDGTVLTYGEFAALVDRCAAGFARFGIGRGTHVALALPNLPVVGAAWIALQRLGAVAIGLNVNLVPHEVEYTLRTADAAVLIVDRDYLGIFDGIAPASAPVPEERIIVHGARPAGRRTGWEDLMAAADRPVVGHSPDPAELASIIYTSGSMGLPKAAMLPHAWHTTSGWVRARQGPPVANILVDSPFYYMAAQWRFAMAMYLGAAVCVAARPTLARYLDRLLDWGIDHCSASAQTAKLDDDPRYARLRLGWVTSSGLPKALQGPLEARLGAPVREIYGATEIGSAVVMPTLVTDMVGSGSCGMPDAFRRVRIVDADGNDVRPGAAGELWVAGQGISLGYYNNPEATAATHAGIWYRTGDLFECDGRGFYYWKSRIKDIIRRSKENISAVEVETAVRAMPEVQDVCALPVPDDHRDEEVKIYVQLVPGETAASVPPARILTFARTMLAPFKVPRYIEYVAEFERTASNKISKLALRRKKADLREGSWDAVADRWH
ncbi:MAG: class I adenylate-forming enzyme family protein [Alphaproteobacteria bacterium]